MYIVYLTREYYGVLFFVVRNNVRSKYDGLEKYPPLVNSRYFNYDFPLMK